MQLKNLLCETRRRSDSGVGDHLMQTGCFCITKTLTLLAFWMLLGGWVGTHPVQAGSISEVVTFQLQSGYSTKFLRNNSPFYARSGGGGKGRGFNLGAIHPVTGETVRAATNYDTWGQGAKAKRSLIDDIKQLPDGTILLITTADEAGITTESCAPRADAASVELINLLQALGSLVIRQHCWRLSFAMIAVKGQGKALAEAVSDRRWGPVDIEHTFRFNTYDTSAEQVGWATANHEWRMVELRNMPNDPVVILGPPTFFGPNPGTVRVRTISDRGFQIRFEEWDYRARDFRDYFHIDETVAFLIVESGRFTRSDGSLWEADIVEMSGTHDWVEVRFREPFPAVPHLLLTAQTANESSAITVRARNVTRHGFELAMLEEEAALDGHSIEEVGYLAVHSALTSKGLFFGGRDVPFHTHRVDVGDQPALIVGGRLFLEEEQSFDHETKRAVLERFDVLVLGPWIFAQQITDRETDTGAPRVLVQ